jgi:glycosyltransferase involved in cell wall biosynthesis
MRNSKRVLFISRDFPNILGGVSDHTYHLSTALAKIGFNVFVLTSANRKVVNAAGEAINIVASISKWGILGMLDIINKIEAIKPDCIFLQYVPHMYNRYGITFNIALLSIILRLKKHKVITIFHEVALELNLRLPFHLMVAGVQRLIAYLISICSRYIIISIRFYEATFYLFRKKLLIIPIGSNILPWKLEENEKAELRAKLAPHKEVMITTFGTNPAQRGYDTILEMLKEYKKRDFRIPLKIVFVGHIDNISRLSKLSEELGVKELVCFTGYLEARDIFKHLASSDIAIVLDAVSDHGKGGACLRSGCLAAAYAASLPIIANKGTATDVFLKNRENILFIKKIKAQAILDAILSLYNNSSLMQKLQNGAQNTYATYLDWHVIAEQYAKIANNAT